MSCWGVLPVDANPANPTQTGLVEDYLESPPKPQPQWFGGGRLWRVEEVDIICAEAERAQTRAGYTVTVASDGDEGLVIVAGGAEFDLIVSDVVIPEMDGPSKICEVRKLRPDMPVLFMSGYAEEQLRDQIGIADVHFLPKPFSVAQISEKVGAVLGGVR